uniref:Uncharacterized protein n=1 Tax=Timema genevievae TaxID=629358 RepID=A0A7R9K8D8_TIMGE|nr:unnamed protein product [Timema genevievae]
MKAAWTAPPTLGQTFRTGTCSMGRSGSSGGSSWRLMAMLCNTAHAMMTLLEVSKLVLSFCPRHAKL